MGNESRVLWTLQVETLPEDGLTNTVLDSEFLLGRVYTHPWLQNALKSGPGPVQRQKTEMRLTTHSLDASG